MNATTFRRWWEKDFLKRELILAVTTLVLFVFWVEIFGGREVVSTILKSTRSLLYPAIVSAFGSLFGFVITAMSIILSWSDKEKFAALRRKKGYSQLWPVFGSTVRWLGFATLAAVLAILFDQDGKEWPLIWYLVALCVTVAVFRLARCIWVLENLIILFAPHDSDDNSVSD